MVKGCPRRASARARYAGMTLVEAITRPSTLTRHADPVVRPDEPALPPPIGTPPSDSGDHRTPRVRFANWMESTFGRAYLPLTMALGGAAAGAGAFLLLDRTTHIRPLAITAGLLAGAAGAVVSGAAIFSD